MNNWEKFNKTSLPEEEEFYSNLNMKDVTDSDYNHAKLICKNFEKKNLGEYHLYLKISYFFQLASSFKKDQSKIRLTN